MEFPHVGFQRRKFILVIVRRYKQSWNGFDLEHIHDVELAAGTISCVNDDSSAQSLHSQYRPGLAELGSKPGQLHPLDSRRRIWRMATGSKRRTQEIGREKSNPEPRGGIEMAKSNLDRRVSAHRWMT